MTDPDIGSLPTFITEPDPEVYHSGNYVTLDFETTNFDKGTALNPRNRIVLAVWRLGPNHPSTYKGRARGIPTRSSRRDKYNIRWGSEYELQELVRAIEAADFLIAHNAKFELQWLERCGLDLSNVVVYCTQLGEYVIGGNRYQTQHLSLDKIAGRRYGEGKLSLVSKLIKAGVCPSVIPRSWLERYCIRDVELTERLFHDQLRDMEGTRLLPVQYARCLLTPVLADIEKNGMCVDGGLVRTRLADVERQYVEQERKLNKITGGINLNSPKQLGGFLYDQLGFKEVRIRKNGAWVSDRTATGNRKTDAGTIKGLTPKNAAQRNFVGAFVAYKELYNELTKYLRKFADCAAHGAGILRAVFNQTTTRTHRTSSTGAEYSTQFQNFPRAYKPLFKAREPEWLVGECDGAQLEFRIGVHLGRDPVGLEHIEEGVDVHRASADIIGVPRQDAKAHTFKPLYGGSSGTPKEREYYQYFKDTYKGITRAQQSWIDTVLGTGSLETEWGLRFYWPGTRITSSGYVTNTTSICNYPVQSFATAEIIPAALVCFWHRLKRSDLAMYLVNTIHDSIIAEIPPTEVGDFHRLSKTCLIDDVYRYLRELYNIKLTVPLGAGVKVGTHWSGEDCAEYVPEGLQHDKGEVSYKASKEMYSFGV